VKLPTLLVPKVPGNLLKTAVLCVLLLALDLFLVPAWARSPKKGLGLLFGILATLLFLFEMAYPLRRPRAKPFRSAQSWVQAHVYLGLVALLAVYIHAGFGLPHGFMGWILLLLSLWVTLTGLLGVFLQKWIPRALAQGATVTALFERIPVLVKDLENEAENLVEGASEVVEEFYRGQVQAGLSHLKPSFAFILDVQGGQDKALEPFHRVIDFVSPEDRETVLGLMNIYTDKLELDAQYSLQLVLRHWALWTLHAPLAGVLLAVVAFHIFAWALY
jgi:hypothetical protein